MSDWTSGPVPTQDAVIARLRQSNEILRAELFGDRKRAFRAFWRGSVFGAILATGAFIASAAFSGDTADFGGTGCTLVPVAGQAHVAEVRCRNVETAGASLNEVELDAGGMVVHLAILHGPGNIPDHFTVTPAPGFVAEPQTLVLEEYTDGVVFIYQFVGA